MIIVISLLSAFKNQLFKMARMVVQHRVLVWQAINMINLVAIVLILTNVNLEHTSVLITFALTSVRFQIQKFFEAFFENNC